MLIRVMTTDDWEELRSLRLQALQTDPVVFLPLYEQELAKDKGYYDWLLENSTVVGAWIDNRLCGMSILTRSWHDKQKHRAVCSFTYVTPDKRGLGLTRKIKEFVFAEAKSLGFRICVSGIMVSNDVMRKLNRSMGCVEAYIEKDAMVHEGAYYDLVYSYKYL